MVIGDVDLSVGACPFVLGAFDKLLVNVASKRFPTASLVAGAPCA